MPYISRICKGSGRLQFRGTKTGTWNVYPVQDGDHMFLQGGLFHKHEIRPFYLELLETIRKAEEEEK